MCEPFSQAINNIFCSQLKVDIEKNAPSIKMYLKSSVAFLQTKENDPLTLLNQSLYRSWACQ